MAHPYEWPGEREDRVRPRDESRAGDPGNDDRYAARPRGGRDARPGMEPEARRLRGDLERGWRRLSEGVRHAFEDDPEAYRRDPRRAGGMFGGEDRPGGLFSHGDGVRQRLRGGPEGPHRGKGPRGYVRSDARILEDVCDRLADDDRLDASDIEVLVDAGEVTLNGRVPSRADKHRAEDLAEQVSGVKHLQNNLRVRPPEAEAAETRKEASMGGPAVGPESPAPQTPTPQPPTPGPQTH